MNLKYHTKIIYVVNETISVDQPGRPTVNVPSQRVGAKEFYIPRKEISEAYGEDAKKYYARKLGFMSVDFEIIHQFNFGYRYIKNED